MLGPPVTRLQPALVEVAGIERRIEAQVRGGLIETHAEVSALLGEVEALVHAHGDAIRERLAGTAAASELASEAALSSTEAPGLALDHPLGAALRDVYGAIQSAVIAYAALEVVAHRVRDSWVMADAGTTSHLARDHMQEYIAISGRLVKLMTDVLVEELDAAETPCGCTCPCCGIGLCMCAASTRGVFAQATAAAQPYIAEHGVEVQTPRPGSAAAAAGLRRGDVIVAVDGEPVDALRPVAMKVRDHQPGDLIEFAVRRTGGEVTVLVEHRREGVDINEDECMLPAGQTFYLDQAAEVQRQLRARSGGSNGSGEATATALLASLSPRQLQVLRLVALGATNPMIAEELELSRATVAQHIRNMLDKLGVANRTEATRLAAEEGILAGV